MHYKLFYGLLLLSMATILPSCLNNTTDDSEVSDDPTLASLTFGANDSIPNLEDAVFTIDTDNRLVYNKDSLPFQTRIDSVFPTFTFNNPSSGAILYCGEDTIILTNNDTVDFSVQPVRLLNYAENGIDTIWYNIYVNVHQVDPELYIWNQQNTQIYTQEGSVQKAIWFNHKLYLYISSGINNYLYTSSDAQTWTMEAPITGLPKYNNFNYMVEFNGSLYIANDTNLYSSSDGIQWNKSDLSTSPFSFVNLLYTFNGKLWGITQQKSDNKYYFASSNNGIDWSIGSKLPTDFPINDFAAVSFFSRTNKPKALVMGGYSAENKILNTRWATENGEYWVNFTIEQPEFGSLAGASIIPYDDKLLLFGGVDKNNQLIQSHLLETNDEGLNWIVPDTLTNRLPDTYQIRSRQSVVLDNDSKFIYIVGGQTRTEVLRDCWRGRLNRATWE